MCWWVGGLVVCVCACSGNCVGALGPVPISHPPSVFPFFAIYCTFLFSHIFRCACHFLLSCLNFFIFILSSIEPTRQGIKLFAGLSGVPRNEM